MAAHQAKLLLQVDNLSVSLDFYTTRLGWLLVDLEPSGEAALLHIFKDYQVVLIEREKYAKRDVERKSYLSRWLLPRAHQPQPGDLVYVSVASVVELANKLQECGFSDLRQEEDPGSIRKLFVPTPDGYTIVYWEELYPSDQEIIEMYAAGADELERVIHGLSDDQFNLTEAPGKWSIRQQVLHFIDLELIAIHKVKFALAESGRVYQGNSFSQNDWCRGLNYEARPIEPEVQMFRALRQHILGLIKHLPEALQRTVKTTNREESVAQLLKMMSGHAMHHIRAVERIRELHGY